jgi:hypothetical protein
VVVVVVLVVVVTNSARNLKTEFQTGTRQIMDSTAEKTKER